MRVHDFSSANLPLHSGDELHCPHCRSWHPVAATNLEGTEFTRRMLFWNCRGGQFYAGNIGTTSRHETRRVRRPFVRAILQSFLDNLIAQFRGVLNNMMM